MLASFNHILIEGIDRIGKSTLIDKIINEYGYRTQIHHGNARACDAYDNNLFHYSVERFINSFKILETKAKTIHDRFHLGECVYSPMYRKFSGEYVFDIENEFINKNTQTTTLLVLLYTSNFDFIQDDGNSFDFNKKELEQTRFKKAFKKSKLTKVSIDIANKNGTRKTEQQVLDELSQKVLQLTKQEAA